MAERRASWFRGKVCVDCGSDRNLELDHVDPSKKVTHNVWSWSEDRRNDELSKCVVRCEKHHMARTVSQLSELWEGEKSRSARLTRAEAWEIFESNEPLPSLAAQYGVNYCTIWDIKKKRSWKCMHLAG